MAIAALALVLASQTTQPDEAPTGFDNKSNGLVDDPTHQADQVKFDEVEGVADGLGPLYNAQSCRECHQNPTSGGASQVAELRVGHLGPDGRFVNPDIPIARGTEIIKGRTLVNDRAICPSAAFPDTEIQERVPASETVRTTRLSLNLLGDGFVEAVADKSLVDLAHEQCTTSHGKICGLVIRVPIVEAPRQSGVGRFGWKDQHASLLSFSGDAYLNEMGITSPLFPDEVTKLCNTAAEPNDKPAADGLSDIDHFARFIRAAKAPARDATLAARVGVVRQNRLRRLPCANPDHGGRGHEDQRRRVHDTRGAWREVLPSFRRFSAARCGDRRRHRDSCGGALRARGPANAGGVLPREFPEDAQPRAHGAAVGRAPAPAADA